MAKGRKKLRANAKPKAVEERIIYLSGRVSPKFSFGSLSPQRVGSILRNIRYGYNFSEFYELLDDVAEKDFGAIGAELNKRYLSVSRAPWEIVPADNEDELSKRIAEFVWSNLSQIPQFHLTLQEIDSAIFKGLQISEIVWKYYKNELWIETLIPRPLNWFDVSDEKIQRYDETGKSIPLENNKWLIHKITKDGLISKAGLGRTLIWLYLFRKCSVEDWVAFL